MVLSLVAVGVSMGCSSSRGPSGEAPPPPDSGAVIAPDGGGDTRPEATFAWISENVLASRCVACHDAGEIPRAMLPLNPELAYDALVNRSSIEVVELDRVEPGDPDASYLFRKITGTHASVCEEHGLPTSSCWSAMPPPAVAPRLSEDAIEAVREWIEAGALP